MKIGKHAWNVFPLQAFGYLLGREDGIHVALPCSKTRRWYDAADRWTGIESHAHAAAELARGFGMELAGFYASSEDPVDPVDPGEPWRGACDDHVILSYRPFCCHACSSSALWFRGRRLARRDDWRVTPGRRIDPRANSQRRIFAAWREQVGPIDYSNGYVRPEPPAVP